MEMNDLDQKRTKENVSMDGFFESSNKKWLVLLKGLVSQPSDLSLPFARNVER